MFDESVSIPSIWASMDSWFSTTVLFVLVNVTIGFLFFNSRYSKQKQKEEDQPNSTVLQRLRSINLYNFRSQEPHPSNPGTHEQIHQTQYVFGQNHQEQSAETQTQYVFGHNNQENSLETVTHYDFDQPHQEKLVEKETQHVFQQICEPPSLNTDTQLVLAQTYEEHGGEEEDDEIQTLEEVYSQLNDHRVIRTTSDTNPVSRKKRAPKMRKSASMKVPFGHFEEDVEVRRPATVKEQKVSVLEGDDEVDAKADDFINKFKQQLKLQRLDSFMRYKEMITRGSSK